MGAEGTETERTRERLVGVWRRVLSLSWPVMAEQTTRTLMRTVDVFVTGLLSPAAVAAVGLADLYARFPLRIGLGLGGGAIALSSQDTGRGADANRDEAVTQALVLGVLTGIPFVAFGLLFGRQAIALLGAPPRVARMGGTYLGVILATAPARHVALIGARSLQGTGDTRTPMYVNVVANVLNVVGSVALGLGSFGVPDPGVIGVGLATAGANVFTACVLVVTIAVPSGRFGGPWTAASFVRPRNPVIARQLVAVSLPRIGEGLVATLAEFPFNALLLGFGTAVNAAFQIGRRAYQQVTGPLSRGYAVAANVVVGQPLGRGDPGRARLNGWAVCALGLLTVGAVGVLVALLARPFVALFTDDPATLGYAADFARTYGFAAPFLVGFTVLSGALQGASDTRTPFRARVVGTFGGLLGVSYLLGVVLGYGVLGAYVGIAASYVAMALLVVVGFRRGDWATRAATMLDERSGTEA
jgi:putative MATE family efflux protein